MHSPRGGQMHTNQSTQVCMGLRRRRVRHGCGHPVIICCTRTPIAASVCFMPAARRLRAARFVQRLCHTRDTALLPPPKTCRRLSAALAFCAPRCTRWKAYACACARQDESMHARDKMADPSAALSLTSTFAMESYSPAPLTFWRSSARTFVCPPASQTSAPCLSDPMLA